MSKQKHTPEPWKVIMPGHGLGRKYRCVQIGKDDMYSTLEMLPADARRIVACVNNCRGINPEAVPALIEACEAVSNSFALMPSGGVVTKRIDIVRDALGQLSAALGKVKGQE